MDLKNDEAIVEAILFVSGAPVDIKNISSALEKDDKYTINLIENLAKKYETSERGFKIIRVNNSFQLCTNPKYFEYIKKLYSVPEKKVLSQAMLETLAIITYKQPVTKSQIESIRGVNSDHVVNTLMKYNLITEKGRLDAPGKPILFGTSEEFLKHFEFNKIKDFHNLLEESKILENIET